MDSCNALRQARPFGATVLKEAVYFQTWAPSVKKMEVKIVSKGEPARYFPMRSTLCGCFEVEVEGAKAGDRYLFRLDNAAERPDPYSRAQPEGVFGPSEVVDPKAFRWSCKDWKGMPLETFIFYELHIGVFTAEGTFEAVIPYLDYLKHELGITAIELMPVASFPGKRGWGYDGVHRFAPQACYGGPVGLKRLVDACHLADLSVVLDVCYNHAGPEGNTLPDFGPYFTKRYRTPWGEAVNYDGPGSDFVRQYAVDNALYWMTEFQMDALRLDAIHAIIDQSAKHVLRELKEAVTLASEHLKKPLYLISESDLNDPKVIASADQGGYGHDAQWNDDFHHALHALLTDERQGYYQDFGRVDQLGRAIEAGFVMTGGFSSFRDRKYGRSSEGCAPLKFIVFSQNHDQIGNRPLGDRLSASVSFEARKLAAAAVLLSPNLPLLFMGEEYGETAPFQFFTDFQDPALAKAVQRGRIREALDFGWTGKVPDPQSEETFLKSKIALSKRKDARLFSFYRDLIALRKKERRVYSAQAKRNTISFEDQKCLTVYYSLEPEDEDGLWIVMSFNAARVSFFVKPPSGEWEKQLDSQEALYGGEGRDLLLQRLPGGVTMAITLAPYQAAVYRFMGSHT